MGNNIKKYIKFIILACIGGLFILTGLLSWNLYFSKFQIFYEQEELFLETVKRFYSMNSNFLPKIGETREMTLQDLYDGNHIDDLVIPKTDKLCDSNSWVRVYKNDNGEYEYITYLKCGKFESDVDHNGPMVTLNGDDEIILSLNSDYKELGIKNVVDDVDGEINIENVVIDSSKVDTSKVGTYEVIYTVGDKTYNKTTKTRKVIVVRNLTEVVKNETDKTNYYRGSVDDNYVLFSGMLFRIVNVNDDGSIKIITEEAVTNLRANYNKYEGSNVDTWLKEIFYKNLNNADNYLVDSTYCVGNIKSVYDYSTECSETITSKVGLLSIGDYVKTLGGEESALYSTNYMLSNKIGNNYVDVPYTEKTTNGLSSGILAAIRPVITLKSNIHILAGNGTLENPYKLDDYSYGKAGELINTRLVGEYLEYSGLTFRIIGIDSNDNVRLISSEAWSIQPDNKKLSLSVSKVKNLKFNLEEEDNPGYILNNEYTDYISMKSVVDTEYEIPVNDSTKKYSEYETDKIKAMILLPKTYEMFASSGNHGNNRSSMYLYIDSSTNNELIFMINGQNGKVFELNKTNFSSYNIKFVLTLKGTLKIIAGNGTINDPYSLK